eukprot:9369739-Prorocentrum_lima.AAC.1
MEVRSDTPTEVADSSPPPFSHGPAADPATALQQQLHECHLSLATALQRTMADAQAHMRDIMEHTVQSAMAELPNMLASRIASV